MDKKRSGKLLAAGIVGIIINVILTFIFFIYAVVVDDAEDLIGSEFDMLSNVMYVLAIVFLILLVLSIMLIIYSSKEPEIRKKKIATPIICLVLNILVSIFMLILLVDDFDIVMFFVTASYIAIDILIIANFIDKNQYDQISNTIYNSTEKTQETNNLSSTLEEKLFSYKRMFENGTISEEEYNELRTRAVKND